VGRLSRTSDPQEWRASEVGIGDSDSPTVSAATAAIVNIRPMTSWSIFMCWHDLLFMHWPVRAQLLRPLIPPPLELDTFDGEAWIGVVPFRMSHVRHRFLPPLPWLIGVSGGERAHVCDAPRKAGGVVFQP